MQNVQKCELTLGELPCEFVSLPKQHYYFKVRLPCEFVTLPEQHCYFKVKLSCEFVTLPEQHYFKVKLACEFVTLPEQHYFKVKQKLPQGETKIITKWDSFFNLLFQSGAKA